MVSRGTNDFKSDSHWNGNDQVHRFHLIWTLSTTSNVVVFSWILTITGLNAPVATAI